MASTTQSIHMSTGPIPLSPGHLEPVEELPGDSDIDDDNTDVGDNGSENLLSDIEDNIDDDDQGDREEGSFCERDPVFEKIKETISKTQRSGSLVSDISFSSDVSDSPQVQTSQLYASVPYGIQPRSTYEHSSQHADIMGGKYIL